MARYYLDTCIWRDFHENRIGSGGKPLGKIAFSFIIQCAKKKEDIIISDKVISELHGQYSQDEVESLFKSLAMVVQTVRMNVQKDDILNAEALSRKHDIPRSDALHAILSQKANAILITRDKHFLKIKEECIIRKPEELL